MYLPAGNQRKKVIGYISDTLTKVVHGLMAEGKVHQIIAKNDRKHKGELEGTWVPVSGV